MSNIKWFKLSKYQQLYVIILGMTIGSVNITQASELNAGAVMSKMNTDQRFSYVSGVIEGLAYSRWQRDKPDETGMKCIHNWYYQDKAKRWESTIIPVFERYKDKSVGAILYVLTKKKCGT